MKTIGLLLISLGMTTAFVPTAVQKRASTLRMAAGGAGEDWRSIIGSEANLGKYLGEEGFRYNLNKTPQEIEKEGDFNFFEKLFGATSNNAARLAARSYGRALTIEAYDAQKAKENKEWIAKYGYKRWGTSYMDKSSLEEEKGAAATTSTAPKVTPQPAKAPAKARTSLPFLGGVPKAGRPDVETPKKTPKIGSAVKVAAITKDQTPFAQKDVPSVPSKAPTSKPNPNLTVTRPKGGGSLDPKKW